MATAQAGETEVLPSEQENAHRPPIGAPLLAISPPRRRAPRVASGVTSLLCGTYEDFGVLRGPERASVGDGIGRGVGAGFGAGEILKPAKGTGWNSSLTSCSFLI